VQVRTLTPVWNENWWIKNVPQGATLEVMVYGEQDIEPCLVPALMFGVTWILVDKDDSVRDDFIGKFSTPLRDGAQECRLDSNGVQRGTLWFEVSIIGDLSP
jgi:hypothetical protein